MNIRRERNVFAILFLVALGLMATMVSAASAQWLENGIAITKNLLVEITKHTEHLTLDVPSKNLKVLCKKVEGVDVLLAPGLPAVASGTLLFSECDVRSNEVLQVNCTVDHITVGFKAKPIEHNGKTYVLFEPVAAGGSFTTILFLGELCALPEKNNVKGSLVGECLTAELKLKNCLTELVTQYLHEAPAALFPGDSIKYGSGEVATNLLGVIAANLSTGLPWSGHV